MRAAMRGKMIRIMATIMLLRAAPVKWRSQLMN